MAGFSFHNRAVGAFSFEAEIIKTEHAGFLKEVGKNLFQLCIDPFSGKPRDINYYVMKDKIIPEDLGKPYHLDVHFEGEDRDGFVDHTTLLNVKRRLYFVEGVSEFIKLPMPRINTKDLLAIVSSGWKLPYNDYLDFSLALLLLSSPNAFNSPGGLGGESYFLSDKHTDDSLRNHLKRTAFRHLPKELRADNPQCSYNLVENDPEISNVMNKVRGHKCKEVTFNIVYPTNYYKLVIEDRTPTVPSVIRDASPLRTSGQEPNWDVIEWVLRARLLRPKNLKSLMDTARKLSVDYNKKYEQGLGQLGFIFDEYNISQTALAISRLQMSSHFTGKMLREYDKLINLTNDVVDEIIKVRKGKDLMDNNEFLKYPKEARIVLSSISKLYKVKVEGVDVEDVSEDIGYLVDYNAIVKSINAWYEDGSIYSVEPYKQMKPVLQRGM